MARWCTPEKLGGSELVTVQDRDGTEKVIEARYVALVFAPEKRRGGGVLFTHVYPLVDVRDSFLDFIEHGAEDSLAFYPLGIPLEDRPVLHLELAA